VPGGHAAHRDGGGHMLLGHLDEILASVTLRR